MKERDNKNINFDDKYEQIIAAMQERERSEFVDIVSDSSRDLDRPRSGNRYKKKEKSGFKAWWKQLTKGKKAALISVTSIFLVIALLLGCFFICFRYNYNAITTDPDELGFSGVKQKGVINVALFGVDSRDETVFTGNTDSIMILSLNTKTKKVKIFSIMRDTFVPMEYNGKDYFGKINSAYSKGPEHAIKTLNQIFDLDISEYATVNFFGMADIIDAVGGIPATITEDELKWKGYGHPNLNNCMDEICNEMGLNAKDYYIKSAGEQTLNGVQAVAYARVRNCTSVWGTRDDYGRTDRQRHVMQGLFNKAIAMNKARYVTLAKALIPCSETSLSYTDILGLAVNVLLHSPSFEQYRLPQIEFNMPFSGSSRYGSVVYYDLDYAAKLVNAVIYDDVTMEEFIEQNPIEKNDWYAKMAKGDSGRRPSGGGTTQNNATQNPTTNQTESNTSNVESDVCTHVNTITKGAKDATEASDGYTGDLYCADCGKLLQPGQTIAKLTPSEPTEPTEPSEP
ncbi:MAG: LCP family protein, partial [Clostridia bacterium]|nr:LCP family protein [Clostridia bacterium]